MNTLTSLEFASLGEVEATGKIGNLKGQSQTRMYRVLMRRKLIVFGSYTTDGGQLYTVTNTGMEALLQGI